MKLMIIEGAGKIKTLRKFLPNDFKVIATAGHFREINNTENNKYGFNFEDFIPKWDIIQGKENITKDIKANGNSANEIYIATDPDREGEGIAWHIYETLDKKDLPKTKRVTFTEITQNEINKALNNPRDLDNNMVNSQFARAVLDKLFGYKSSKLVQIKAGGKSAGRVQSVALKLINDREKEIENYKETNWYTIEPTLTDNKQLPIKVSYVNVDGDKYEKQKINTQQEAINLVNNLKKDGYEYIRSGNVVESVKKAPTPYITSDVLKNSKKYGLTTKQTTNVMQTLYEGGFITYPRTDSIRMKPEFCKDVQTMINKMFGEQYYDSNLVFNTKKQKASVQEGHDAIRMTNAFDMPDKNFLNTLQNYLGDKQLKDGVNVDSCYLVYKDIYINTTKACMKPAIYENQDVFFKNNGYDFAGETSKVKFEGFEKMEQKDRSQEGFRTYNPNQMLSAVENDIEIIKKQKNPKPKRYNQATLIKELEKREIGRPSTYATMVDVNIERGYVVMEKDEMIPTPIGRKVADFLDDNLNEIVNTEYTKKMEESLDEIAHGKLNWNMGFLKNFYDDLEKIIQNKFPGFNENQPYTKKQPIPLDAVTPNGERLSRIDANTLSTLKCPKDGGNLKTTDTTEYINCCNSTYDPKTKKSSGCDFFTSNATVNRRCPECGSVLLFNSKTQNLTCLNNVWDAKSKSNVGSCKYIEFAKTNNKTTKVYS